jgi:DNA-directed RNA polymerase subunit M/transcription elongation factor TFIIS
MNEETKDDPIQQCKDCPKCQGVMKYFLNGRFLRCPDCDYSIELEI